MEHISNYKKLDTVIFDILRQQSKPITANQIREKIHKQYKVTQISTNPRSIAQKMKRNPHIDKVNYGKQNYYFLISF